VLSFLLALLSCSGCAEGQELRVCGASVRWGNEEHAASSSYPPLEHGGSQLVHPPLRRELGVGRDVKAELVGTLQRSKRLVQWGL